MSKINDGGLLSPWWDRNEDGTHRFVPGACTLRDYFAGQALIAIVSKLPLHGVNHLANVTHISVDRDTEHEIVMDVARGAYRYADAMLKLREAEHGAR